MRPPPSSVLTAAALALGLLAWPASAQEIEVVAPEDPLPPPVRDLSVAPPEPVARAPDARDIFKNCERGSTFTDCLGQWRPPEPPKPKPEKKPEEPETKEARPGPPPPPDANTPVQPALAGGAAGPPPPPNPEAAAAATAADRATYDALMKAVKDVGLDGKLLLPEPPKDGSATLKLDPTPQKAPAKP